MTALLSATTITSAVSPAVAATALRFPGGALGLGVRNLAVQAKFAYGSGGTTVDAYVQTTFDAGATWVDIANFHFTTAGATRLINLSSATPVTAQVTPSDGAMAANTAQDGLLGDQVRVKYQSSGTYAGGTTLEIDVIGSGRLAAL